MNPSTAFHLERPEGASLVGATPGDLRARELGIVRLSIPLPFGGGTGGSVNVYLIENPDGSLTLFDSGHGTREAFELLEEGIAEAGRRVEEVTRVFVSHGHVDHYGGARFLQEAVGTRVLVHPADHGKVTHFLWPEPVRALHRDYLQRMDVPGQLLAELEAMSRNTELLGRRLEKVEPVAGGERIRFARFEAEVLHLPGHSTGQIGLHVPEHRLLFSADHLLRGVSPNPLLELGEKGGEGKFLSLLGYLDSLTRVERLELEWVLPGHGEPFGDHRKVAAGVREVFERRQQRLLACLRDGPRTAYELVGAEFGGRGRRLQLLLMLSEIIGNLEVLEAKGAVRRRDADGRWRFEPAETA